MKIKPKFRKVVFTDHQMILARNSGHFEGKTHRDFIEWLFLRQHKCKVVSHELLTKQYKPTGDAMVVIIEGQLGQGLMEL